MEPILEILIWRADKRTELFDADHAAPSPGEMHSRRTSHPSKPENDNGSAI